MIQIDKEYRIYRGTYDFHLQKKFTSKWKTVSFHGTIESAYKKYARIKINDLISDDDENSLTQAPENVMTVKEAGKQIEKLIEKL